jgi:hypothetical protein
MVADALVEIAEPSYPDVADRIGAGHQYYRLVGGATTRSGKPFEFNGLKFFEGDLERRVITIAGHLEAKFHQEMSGRYPEILKVQPGQPTKLTSAPVGEIDKTFRNNAFAFFESHRNEKRSWRNSDIVNPIIKFDSLINNKLDKPIIIESSLEKIKVWILDVILDSSIDPYKLRGVTNIDSVRNLANVDLPNQFVLSTINDIIGLINGFSNINIVRAGRHSFDRKLQIIKDGELLFPSLESMSSGQIGLFTIFCTLLQYSDVALMNGVYDSPHGIICIDEADSHLHPDLQFSVLPKLIQMFPKIQFMVSSHSPLFTLGMQNLFGDDGFSLIEMPTGRSISAECYQDFQSAFEFFKDTKEFEKQIEQISLNTTKPLVLCEGKTDPKYISKAFKILGHEFLLSKIDIDCIGKDDYENSQGGGKSHLNKAWSFLKNNPELVKRKIILLYDSDAKKADEETGSVKIRSMPLNNENDMVGIENMFSKDYISKDFINCKKITKNGLTNTIQEIDKIKLCEAICNSDDVILFEKFKTIIEMIRIEFDL